jgi:hypothetical protein
MKAFNFNTKAYTNFKSKSPNSNVVFLSRVMSSVAENLTASLSRQPPLIQMAGLQPKQFHRRFLGGFKTGIY